MLLSPGGIRWSDGDLSYVGTEAAYSSSSIYAIHGVRMFGVDDDDTDITVGIHQNYATAHSMRCFKNTTNAHTLTIHANG